MKYAVSLLPVSILLWMAFPNAPAQVPDASFQKLDDTPAASPAESGLQVEVASDTTPLPCRVIITAADGTHPDGSGRGVYKEGRFFAEGTFKVSLPPGDTRILIRCGPEYESIEQSVVIPAGRIVRYRAQPRRWINLASLGWYGGDHHVHTQHDATAAIRIDPGYTALQARANGLSLITEADAEFSAEAVNPFETVDFLYRNAPEIRSGPYVGHLITPGIAAPFEEDVYKALVHRPLPALAVQKAVRQQGGVLVRTHMMTPPHQLHWMGATEVWSDAVLRQCGDLMDIDGPASEMLWFAALNLGNRVGVSSYTDCALGRVQTLSPGDRRIYTKADSLDYGEIIKAMRKGNTFATNGGPLFAFLSVGEVGHGGTFKYPAGKPFTVTAKVQCLEPLRRVELFGPAGIVHSFNVTGRSGDVALKFDHLVPYEFRPKADWLVLRAQDELGNWAITSPVYLEPQTEKAIFIVTGQASSVLLEIGNHTRFTQPRLRREFFAHMILTVSPPEELVMVRLMKDGQPVQSWEPADGDSLFDGRIPVTDIEGEYGPGWIWHRSGKEADHFQADRPVTEAGWYHVEAETSAARTLRSEAIRFDPTNRSSRALSTARLEGMGTSLTLRGYGEDMPLAGLPDPTADWWYKNKTAYRLTGDYRGTHREVPGGKVDVLEEVFRVVKE